MRHLPSHIASTRVIAYQDVAMDLPLSSFGMLGRSLICLDILNLCLGTAVAACPLQEY